MNPIETIKHKGYQINIYQDNFAESPRLNSTLGTIVYTHPRYTLGDKELTTAGEHGSLLNDFFAYINDEYDIVEELSTSGFDKISKWVNKNLIYLPVYLYDHGGLTINTIGFHCRWDSGLIGYIYIDKDNCKKESLDFNKTEVIKNNLITEIDIFDSYLRGGLLRLSN